MSKRKAKGPATARELAAYLVDPDQRLVRVVGLLGEPSGGFTVLAPCPDRWLGMRSVREGLVSVTFLDERNPFGVTP